MRKRYTALIYYDKLKAEQDLILSNNTTSYI